MEQTTNEIVKLFRERLKYPIISIYLIVLIIYNWDVLAVFFLSNKPIEERVNHINQTYNDPHFYRVWVPLIKAVTISILAPAIMFGLDLILQRINKGRTNIRNKKVLEVLKNKEQTANLEWKIEEAKSGKKTIEDWENKIIEINRVHISEIETQRNLMDSFKNQISQKDLIISDLTLENNSHRDTIYINNYSHIDTLSERIIDGLGEFILPYTESKTRDSIERQLLEIFKDIFSSNYESILFIQDSKSMSSVVIDQFVRKELVVHDIERGLIKLSPLGLAVYQMIENDVKL